jgi:hypothetical protein
MIAAVAMGTLALGGIAMLAATAAVRSIVDRRRDAAR